MKRSYMEMAKSAVFPWNSPDSVREEYAQAMRSGKLYRVEAEIRRTEQEKIDFCLFHCPYPKECVNCLSGGRAAKAGRPKKIKVRIE